MNDRDYEKERTELIKLMGQLIPQEVAEAMELAVRAASRERGQHVFNVTYGRSNAGS